MRLNEAHLRLNLNSVNFFTDTYRVTVVPSLWQRPAKQNVLPALRQLTLIATTPAKAYAN